MNKQFVLFRFLHCFFFSHINQHLNILFFPVQSPKIGFTAILTHDVSNLGDNQVIIFDRVNTNVGIKVITKLPNSEQSYKGKVKTHNYINRQNQSTTGKL
jgi:hypothetical protein